MHSIIDVHCHVLPGIDDGPFHEEESLELIGLAIQNGIRKIIATPHYSNTFRQYDIQQLKEQCKNLENKVRDQLDPQFCIYTGQEILYTADSMEKLHRRELCTLADSDYALMEMMPEASYNDVFRMVREVTMEGYIPILAHIERYQVLREQDKIEELIECGARMQMNYSCIGESSVRASTRWCRKMLKEGMVHFLGTDMHNTEHRSPKTETALRWMAKHLEEDYVDEICRTNAEKILNNVRI